MGKNFHICVAAFAIFISASSFGADVVFASRFDRLARVKVPDKIKPALVKRHIDVAAIEKMSLPKGWNISWKNYPADCRFYVRDSRWSVNTSGELHILGKRCSDKLSRNYRLKFEATTPADAAVQSSRVSIGIYGYGMINHGLIFQKDAEIKRGESISLDVPLVFDRGVPTFRVLLKIHGDVTLKELTVTELPDDIAKAGITVLEGTLKELSQIPDPRRSDYPDCRFTALLEGECIIGGAQCPRKMQLVIDGFRKYKLLETRRLKPGDKIRCFAIPFENLPDEQKSVQQADDLNLFELPNYYALEIEKTPRFSTISSIPFTDKQEYVSVFERKINPPLTAEAVKLQRQAIADSLARINKMLEPYSDAAALDRLNASFSKAWKTEMARDPRGYNRCCGGNVVWRNVDNSFWCLQINRNKLIDPYSAVSKDNLDALAALQDFLNAHGCQLVVGVVPNAFDISARVILKEFREIPDFRAAWVAQQLLRRNIEAIYISDRLLKNFNRYPFAFFYPLNGHPSDTTQDIMTDVISEALKRYHFPETLDKTKFTVDAFPHVYGKDSYLFPPNCDIGLHRAGTPHLCRRVLYDGKEVFPDQQSPVMVWGNSFIQTPMNYPDSLPTLLASKLHMGIASHRLGGKGAMTSGVGLLFAQPEKYLTGKRVMVLILGLLHFEQARFNNIREMDRQMLLLSGKNLAETIAVSGNADVPKQFQNLLRARCLKIPDPGKMIVIDRSVPRDERDRTLLIPVCADAPCPAKLKVNGTLLAIPESGGGVYSYNRIVVPLPKDAEHLTIELEGKSDTTIAMGDIQIFK